MANTVIDSLVVLLDLDPSKFDSKKKQALKDLKEQKEEVRQGTKQYEQYGKQGVNAFTAVRNEALRFISLFLGVKSLVDFTAETTKQGAAMGRLAANTGIATESLGAWEQAIKSIGGDADTAGQAMFSLSQELEKLKFSGESSIVPSLRGLFGDDLKNLDLNKVKDVGDFYIMLADEIEKRKLSPQDANFFLKGIIPDQNTINLILRGGTAVRGYLKDAGEVNKINKEQTEQLERLQRSWENMLSLFNTIGRSGVANLAPYLADFFDWITRKTKYGNLFTDDQQGQIIPIPGKSNKPAGQANGSLYDMIRKLEGSNPGQVSSKGAVGQYQILPETAAQHQLDPTRLSEPAYNEYAGKKIIDDLAKKYNGNPELVALAYHNGEGTADKYAKGIDDGSIGPQTRKYLDNERNYVASHTTIVQGDVNVITQATDAPGIARDIKSSLQSPSSTTQAFNSGAQ